MTPVEQLVQLARDAEAKLSVSLNSPDVLPFAAEALGVIAAHPDLQAEFESVFLEMPSYAPGEFVEVCLHALRWPSLRRQFEVRRDAAVARNDWRAEPVYRQFLEAFEPDWEAARVFYGSFFSPATVIPNLSLQRTASPPADL